MFRAQQANEQLPSQLWSPKTLPQHPHNPHHQGRNPICNHLNHLLTTLPNHLFWRQESGGESLITDETVFSNSSSSNTPNNSSIMTDSLHAVVWEEAEEQWSSSVTDLWDLGVTVMLMRESTAMSESFSTLRHSSGQFRYFTNTRMRPSSWWSCDFLWSVPHFWPTWSDSIRCEPLYHHVINKPWLFYDDVVFCHHSFLHDHDHDCLHGLSYVTPL